MTTLILALPAAISDPAALLDYVLTADNGTVSGHACVPLALLPVSSNRSTRVVVVVPAQALCWHQVTLPKGSLPKGFMPERGEARLRTILEGLLEDLLLDDPTRLHLAIQPQASPDAPVWVAACDRIWLKAWLQALAQTGHTVSQIVPEFSPEPQDDSLYVLGDVDHALLAGRLPQSACWLLVPLSVDALALHGEPANTGTLRQVVAEPATAALAESLFKRPVLLQQRAQRLLQAADSTWDLAQFDLRNAERDRRWAGVVQWFFSLLRAPKWRAARLTLVAALLCNLVGLNAWGWREQANLQAKRQAVRSLLTGTFPKIPVVVDAPVQMAREVATLQRQSGAPQASDLDAMLASISAVTPVGSALTAIDYVAQELRIKGLQLSSEDQSRMILALKQQGLTLTLDGTQWVIRSATTP